MHIQFPKRPRVAASILIAILIVFRLTVAPAQEAPAAKTRPESLVKTKSFHQPDPTGSPRQREFLQQRTYGGAIPDGAYERANETWNQLPRVHPAGTNAGAFFPAAVSGVKGTVWKPIGPSPLKQGSGFVNGRVRAIAIHPGNPRVIYQGASGGGLWRTIDAGVSWTPLFDEQPSLGVGQPSALALDPNNPDTIYVGTSTTFQFFPATPDLNQGILKSTDGGGSWVVLGSGFPANNTGNALATFRNRPINVLIVDPANSAILYASCNVGLFRSTDGGLNWAMGTGGAGNAQTLVLDPSSPANARVLFAGVNGSGIRRSVDGAQTWTTVLNAGTPAVAAALPANSTFGKVVVAVAPPAAIPNPSGAQVIYATMEGVCTMTGCGVSDPLGIFMSTDQGMTWTRRTATGIGGCQCFFTLEMGVDPASPGNGANDILYWGGTGLYRSADSGNNFANVSNGQHVDAHATPVFFRRPGLPSLVYVGNDGGIYRSEDDGAHWTGTGAPGAPPTINAGGLQTCLLYDLDIKNDASASVTLCSLQDNGTGKFTGPGLTWTDNTGGDGFFVRYDQVALGTAYAIVGCDDGVSKSINDGDTWSDITTGIPVSELGCSIIQVNVDPSNAGVIYVSGSSNNLFQSLNAGSTYRQIGPFGGGVGNVEVAKANSNNVAVSQGGNVFLLVNPFAATAAGVTLLNITRNLPGNFVTRLAFDPIDPSVLYATLSGFAPGNIFRTRIPNNNWVNISPSVSVPCNSIALDGASTPTTIYVGTDIGVIRSLNSGASWSTLDDFHLPNVPVTDLRINPQAQVLRASTYGRGAFELVLPTGPVVAVNAADGLNFGPGCGQNKEYLVVQVFNVGTSDLIINGVYPLMGSSDFSVLPNPATPLLVRPNSEVDFTIVYNPVNPGPQKAIIRIASSDPAAPYVDLMATATRTNASITTAIADSGDFGTVCVGDYHDLDLTLNNRGGCDLRINNISSSSLQFQTASVMAFPLLLQPGTALHVPVRFRPTTPGAKLGVIAIESNDPQTPSKLVSVSGSAPSGAIRLAGSTDFGDVCPGTMAEKTIQICNVGLCNLLVTNVAFVPPCPDFTLVNSAFPAVVSHDFCLGLTIRLTPTSCGPRSCSLRIITDDPATPVIILPVTANTPCPEIDIPPDLGFLPEVIQSLGTCNTQQPFPISNKGQCNLAITAISIGGLNAGDFALAGLPSFPIVLQPGHIAGEGDLQVIFAPTVVARDRTATLTVTYVRDPITGATTNVTRILCGEGVYTGARVLVTHGGIPIAKAEKIHLQRINANRNRPRLDTQDQVLNPALVTVIPPAPCEPFQYHREYGTVSNPIQLLPGSYQVTVTALISGKRKTLVVGFDVQTCDYNPTIVVDFP